MIVCFSDCDEVLYVMKKPVVFFSDQTIPATKEIIRHEGKE